MNGTLKLALGALLLLAVGGSAYWLGTQANSAGATAPRTGERKVLYYRNPMGLPDTSPVPKKDAMGMDYVPVYADEAESSAQLSLSLDKVQKLGVKSEAATLRALNRTLRVTGRIEVDERRTYTIAPKFEGWVERLYVNATGQSVHNGQPLFDVYSPELVSAQREHELTIQGLAALKDADDDARQSMQRLAEASRARLKNWNMDELALPSPQSSPASGRGGERERQSSIPAHPRVTFRAPVNGIVLEKKAVQGMRFMPGEMLYQIADLSSVWVIADVPEQDIGQVKVGNPAKMGIDAYPDRSFDGKVSFIYPTLNAATRTVQVRIQVANRGGLLKPDMYAHVQIAAGKGGKVLTVPDSAVIDSGTRQVVLVRLAEGRFEPRAVTLGGRSDDHVEVLDGVSEGEQVVTSANFLIDAESNLKAALGGMGGGHTAHAAAPAAPAERASTRQDSQALPAKAVGHRGQGVLEAINDDGSVSITHDPIATLKWPGMTMDFALANPALAGGIKPGDAVQFELVERGEGEWVITKLQPRNGHEGH